MQNYSSLLTVDAFRCELRTLVKIKQFKHEDVKTIQPDQFTRSSGREFSSVCW